MGLFSFLKKKGDDAPPAKAAARPRAGATSSSGAASSGPSSRLAADSGADRDRQREIARATAAKIDEIEFEMASDIFDDESWGSPRRVPAVASGASSVALVDLNTDGLLAPETALDIAVAPASAPEVEEAAILYANGQSDAAEQALRACLGGAEHDRMPWWMLFDLYQAEARESAFESVAIDYASRFETSPPTYQSLATVDSKASRPSSGRGFSGITPTASLSGCMDATAGVQLARILAPSPAAPVRLEFSAVASVTPEGCLVLLDALQALRRGGRELVLAGADHLVSLLRPLLVIGDGSGSHAPWLLLLELLLLMNREKDFEETAMDYCVTFEVSPPSFDPPAHIALSVATDADADPDSAIENDRFQMPGIISGDINALLVAIEAYAADREALVLDCARLARIDYGAAAVLATRLRQLAGNGGEGENTGRKVELRDLNHLVAALLRLLGASDPIRLYAHRY